jgi:hypothetical protein
MDKLLDEAKSNLTLGIFISGFWRNPLLGWAVVDADAVSLETSTTAYLESVISLY